MNGLLAAATVLSLAGFAALAFEYIMGCKATTISEGIENLGVGIILCVLFQAVALALAVLGLLT